VGLVLGGGGARGAAHIGVLEVLEQLNVPVDCVAGTSMGALVAGAWAAGLSPGAMRAELSLADWADIFQDNPDYAEMNQRTKQLTQRFLPGSESGVSAAGMQAPPGVVAGQKIKLFFNQLVRADAGERDIARLPLPLSIIATDIGNGERVVLRAGSLTQAMRASMSVPGLMAPLVLNGRKLVDGGLVDNLPVREVRERCAADVVIAVNVGSPLLPAEQVSDVLAVSAQVIALLTEQNVQQSKASLGAGDIYIQPDLVGLTAADFARHREAADRGHSAAQAQAAALARLAVPAAEYMQWHRRLADTRPEQPRVDEIQIVGLQRGNTEVVARHLSQRSGEPLNTRVLNRDLLRAFGDGFYEGVDYQLLNERNRQVLRITPVEKRWGPDYLRLGLSLNSNLSQGSQYSLRAGYQKTWLNRLGAEFQATVEIGSTSGASLEFYQPLDSAQTWFAEALASYRGIRTDLFLDDRRVAEYRVGTGSAELRVGMNLGLLGQTTLGWRNNHYRADVETGQNIFPNQQANDGGWLFSLDLDQRSGLYFPYRGWMSKLQWFHSQHQEYGRLAMEGRWAVPLGAWVLAARAAYTGSTDGELPLYDAASLGGFLNLSAFANGQLLGDSTRYTHLRTERIIGRLPMGLRGDMRLGLALEAGKVGKPYTELNRRGWLNSATLYVGGETPLGPVYLGIGHSTQGATNAYLSIGAP
jgi:NTE family protein